MNPNPNKNQISQSTLTFENHCIKKIYNDRITTKVNVHIHRVQQQMEIYQWRTKQFAKIIAYQWLAVEPYNQKEVIFTLKVSQALTSLNDIRTVKGSKVIKNIAKMFSGFSLLYDRFGPFQVSSKMIAFDMFFQPYVWMNNEYSKNQYKRDHISEVQFATNILYLLLSNSHKFQNYHIEDECSKLTNKNYSLQDLSNYFIQCYEKEISSNNKSKISLKNSSEASTLCFSKQSKIRKQNKMAHQFRGLSTINTETFRSYLKTAERQQPQLQRASSLKDINIQSHSFQSINQGSYIKVNVITQGNSLNPHASCLPIKQQLNISIDFYDSQDEHPKEIIELKQLDKYKRCLAKSIMKNQSR